jgi:type IV secretion system protein VirD4
MKLRKLPFKSAALNVVDLIDKHSRVAIDHCRSAANAIVVTTGQEKDPHWNTCSEEGIGGLMAATAWYGQAKNRSLQDVDRLATNARQLDLAIELMLRPDETTGQYPWDGMLARMGGRMQLWSGEEKSGVLSTMARHLQFLRTPAIAAVTRESSFRPQFKRKKQTAYIVCPPEFIRSMSGWIRLMVWALFTSVVNEGLGERRLVHAVLDEAASLEANFGALEDSVDKFRGYGLRCQFYYQSYGQLAKCWPKDQGTTLLSNTSAKIFTGTADMQTASLISSMLGRSTILVENAGENSSGGRNRSWTTSGHGGNSSSGINSGWGTNRGWQQAPRELLKPEEILTLPSLWTITFPGPGMAPVLTQMVRYFDAPGLFRRGSGLFARFFAACRTLLGSILVLAVALVLAGALTQALEEQARQAPPSPRPGAAQPFGPGYPQWPLQPRSP